MTPLSSRSPSRDDGPDQFRLSRRRMLQAMSAAAMAGAGAAMHGPFALAAPVGTPQANATPQAGGSWIVAIAEEPDTLDPHKTGAAVTQTIMRNVCDPLIAKDFDGNYVPGLATEWTISTDGLTWDFTLRTDVTFHDGTPLNADAVKASLDRIVDPATKSAGAKSALGPVESVTVTGPNAVQLKLSKPFAPLLDGLTNSGFIAMVSPTAVESAGDDFGRKPISTGPFMVDEWVSSDHITLKMNPNYKWAPGYLHQGGGAFLDTLTFRIVTEDAARTAAFQANEINEMGVPSTDVESIKQSDQYWTVDHLRKGVVFMEFNVTKAPFDDLQVRQALNYAVDKTAVLNAAVQGLGITADGFLSPSIAGYWSGITDYAPHYDKDKAGQMLDAAGWTLNGSNREKGGQPFKFTLYNLKTDAWDRAVQIVQSQFKDIGVQMDIQDFEFGTLLQKCQAGEHQMEMMGYTYPIADIAYLWFDSANIGTGLNLSHDNDPNLDDLIDKSRAALDKEASDQVYQDLQKYLVDQAIWVPLWIDKYTEAYDKSIQDAKFHPDGYTVYFDAWLSS
jgi:peptide/nickel transport system substrate-binding protein